MKYVLKFMFKYMARRKRVIYINIFFFRYILDQTTYTCSNTYMFYLLGESEKETIDREKRRFGEKTNYF